MTFNQLGNYAKNDFTITGVSTALRTLFINNANNTGGSEARVYTGVGGGTAGDAYYQAAIAAGQFWTWGLDNSASDKFVVSSGAALGTNDVMEVYPAGQINYPLQPAFMAHAVTQAAVTGDGTVYTVKFTNEIFDVGGNFDGVSTFTAPVDGKYLLGTTVAIGAGPFLVGNDEYDLYLIVDGVKYILSTCNPFNCASALTFWKASGSLLINMSAGDTAQIAVFVSGAAKTVDIEQISVVDVCNSFFGYLVC